MPKKTNEPFRWNGKDFQQVKSMSGLKSLKVGMEIHVGELLVSVSDVIFNDGARKTSLITDRTIHEGGASIRAGCVAITGEVLAESKSVGQAMVDKSNTTLITKLEAANRALRAMEKALLGVEAEDEDAFYEGVLAVRSNHIDTFNYARDNE